jgi:hypothetical protein
MEATSSVLGLMVIVALYIAIGTMSAAGSVYLSKLLFFWRKARADIFRIVSYPNRRILFGLRRSLRK